MAEGEICQNCFEASRCEKNAQNIAEVFPAAWLRTKSMDMTFPGQALRTFIILFCFHICADAKRPIPLCPPSLVSRVSPVKEHPRRADATASLGLAAKRECAGQRHTCAPNPGPDTRYLGHGLAFVDGSRSVDDTSARHVTMSLDHSGQDKTIQPRDQEINVNFRIFCGVPFSRARASAVQTLELIPSRKIILG